jgi:hypothetical protein
MLAYGKWIEEQILAPVPHRQYVFALPKLVRPYFRYYRPYLGALCRLVAGLLRSAFATLAPGGQLAFILYVQTFGDLVTRRDFASHLPPRPGYCLSVVFDADVWLDVGAHGRTTQIFDACAANASCNLAQPAVKTEFPSHRRQLCRITDNLNRLRVKLIQPAG